jgi:hypothetical protein
MGAFEHVISLLSFVYALAIAHLLLTVAGIVRGWERVRFSWFHAYWMLNALFVIVVDWISFWYLNTLQSWSVGLIFMTLAIALVDYLQAAMVCPEIPTEGSIDLKAFHATQARRYIGAFALSATNALIANFVLGGAYNVSEWSVQNWAVVPMLVIAVTAAAWRTRWVDIAAPFLLMAIWAFFLIELQGALH